MNDTAELNREPRSLRTIQDSRPSVRLISTQSRDPAERARQLEMAERTQACAIYSRGEVPSWPRNYSPLGDLSFIRNMTELEQTTFANLIPIPNLATFMAASDEAVLQEREQTEVRKYANAGRTPPWHMPGGHTEAPNSASRTPATNRDYSARFQTSPVTANSLPDVNTEMNRDIRCHSQTAERMAGRLRRRNYGRTLPAPV